MPRTASARPQRYVNNQHPLLHHGQVTFTGSTTVDLGIGHNNFEVALVVVGGLAAQNVAPVLSWSRGTRKGTFVIQAGKFTGAADTTIIAATASCTVSFTAIMDATAK